MSDRIHDVLNSVQKIYDDKLKSKSDELWVNTMDNFDDADTSPVLEDTPNSDTEMEEYKNEFFEMSIAALKNIVHNANGILNHLDSERIKENLTEPWLQGMIAVTEDNMSKIHDFVMLAEETDDTESGASGGKKPGLWDNIRKKKERMGKNYRPARTGEKDRPDPGMWKKLTKDSKKSES